jgi:hypothetical protein
MKHLECSRESVGAENRVVVARARGQGEGRHREWQGVRHEVFFWG